MSVADWFPSLSTATGVAILAWLCRNWIAARLTRSIGFEFDKKIEELKAGLRVEEEKVRADLRTKEAEIAALRTSAMAGLSSRQIALDKRRLEAIEQLWSSLISLNKARAISNTISLFKFEVLAERAKKEPKLRELLTMIGTGFDINKDLAQADASKARPFVTPLAWAIYIAILSVITNGVMRWHVARNGLGAEDFADHAALTRMMKVALPEYSSYIDEQGVSAFHFLLDKLDQKLLEEFQAMTSGAHADRASVERAAEILRYSDELMRQGKVGAAQPGVPADLLAAAAPPRRQEHG